jgi:hypothetical protein
MSDGSVLLPPLEGCLYCHAEGSVSLGERRGLLTRKVSPPVIRCDNCGAVALLDIFDDQVADGWRIQYKWVKRIPDFYYVALYLGEGEWLSAREALDISTDGYVQRQRVRQTKAGDLSWLHPLSLNPPPPLMNVTEHVYVALRGVTFREASPLNKWIKAIRGPVLDSGKFYITEENVHLLGQRRDWSYPLEDICAVDYSAKGWFGYFGDSQGYRVFQGTNLPEQMDAQLVAAVMRTLWQRP